MIDLISKYISLAIKHGETTLTGDYKRGNKIHAELMGIIEKFKEEELNIRKQFYTQMYHENDSVKIWTAVTLLSTFENEALTVLKSIQDKDKDIFAITAMETIDIWRKGMMNNLIDWSRLDDNKK